MSTFSVDHKLKGMRKYRAHESQPLDSAFVVLLMLESCNFTSYTPSLIIRTGHYRPTSETPFEWRITEGPIVASRLNGVSLNCR